MLRSCLDWCPAHFCSAMGVKLAKLSPSRGFAAELATAGIITIAAQYGLPTSSSQCITGAIVGVGVLEGVRGVNWIVFLRQFISWMCTLAVVGLLTAALFAQARGANASTLCCAVHTERTVAAWTRGCR